MGIQSPEFRVQGPESSPGSSPGFILCQLLPTKHVYVFAVHTLKRAASHHIVMQLTKVSYPQKGGISTLTTYINKSLLELEKSRVPILLIGLSERSLLGNRKKNKHIIGTYVTGNTGEKEN